MTAGAFPILPCRVMQILKRIQVDAEDLRVRWKTDNIQEGNPIEVKPRILDLKEGYPRVSRPLLWVALTKFSVKCKMLNSLMDLHETTAYNKTTAREGRSSVWKPEGSTREGCPTSLLLFIIFHQCAMKAGQEARNNMARNTQGNWSAMEMKSFSRPTTQ